MKKIILVLGYLLLLSSCSKNAESNACKQETTIVQVKQYDAIECPYDEFNFLIKSEKQRDSILNKYRCWTNNFFEPYNYNTSWIIGSCSKINYIVFKIDGELHRDTCNKIIDYRLILKQDTTSSKVSSSASPIVQYCIMEAVDNSWKINFTRQVINTKF